MKVPHHSAGAVPIRWLIALCWSMIGALFGMNQCATSQQPFEKGLAIGNLDLPPSGQHLLAFFDAYRTSAADTGDAALPEQVLNWTSVAGSKLAAQPISQTGRPQRVRVGDGWVVRFDGQDDCLRLLDTGWQVSDATILIVAAAHENPGNFRGLMAGNAPQQRDYQSGVTIDLGPAPTRAFEQLNVEGRGFGGAKNLRTNSSSFGRLQVIEIHIDATEKQVRLLVDGKAEGSRPMEATLISLDELTLGARYYTNEPGQQQVRGYFSGDLAAVAIYDNLLSVAAAEQARTWLAERYLKMNAHIDATLPKRLVEGVPLVKVDSPPPVKMLIPGFAVREIPIELTNVNNVRYRRDGKLFTLGYNGDIHVLSDSDGDGLEDQAALYWKNDGGIRGPIGMVLTPADYAHGQGVLLASKGKVSMIVDRDGDDRGDQELIVAQGWQEIPQNVDAVGLAMADDGSLYFGLGTANFANPYLISESGKAHYDLNSPRGTVQRISPDWRQRHTVCTGIRFPVAFALNQAGDLFCTEQEGATWLPNGNALDELLHIRLDGTSAKFNRTGLRHYGFPPRHPRHNPDVLDEPAVFEFGPQHQSTCGMVFNPTDPKGACFGPEHWRGDALICGQSRGKIWRTRLAASAAGYIADSQLIACLQMLTVDACVAPNGDLVVACHSGPPDWGTGPAGAGKLFRIAMIQPSKPYPTAAWITTASEIQIAFDQPLQPESVRGLAGRAQIHYGQDVRAGDRYETLLPPYASVTLQQLQPRYDLPIHAVTLSADQRMLTLYTDPILRRAHYAITLQLGDDEYELDVTPTGLQATWLPATEVAADALSPNWQGHLPYPVLSVARELTRQSSAHEQLWQLCQQPGTLTLETIVDLRSMLRPAVQRGMAIDYQWPPEIVSLVIDGASVTDVHAESLIGGDGDKDSKGQDSALQVRQQSLKSGGQRFVVVADEASGGQVKLTMRLTTGAGQLPEVNVSFFTNEDETPRSLPLARFGSHWLQPQHDDSAHQIYSRPTIPELAGGSWGRGRKLFFDQRTQCSRCHLQTGDDLVPHATSGRPGASIGPDLRHLIHRDYNSVLRDIITPGFAINPDYLSHTITTVSGQVVTGVVSSQGDELLVGQSDGQVARLARQQVELMQPLKTSTMPDGLLDKLSEQERRDLLTFLLLPPPSMPLDSPLPAPPLRTRAQVSAALAGGSLVPVALSPLRLVLVDGVKDHGPGEHDYPAWQRAWADLLRAGQQVTVETAHEFPEPEQLSAADVVLFFQKGSFSLRRQMQLDAFLARGGGAVFIHWAVNGGDRLHEFSERIGLASGKIQIRYRHGPLNLEVVDRQHPIMRNFNQLDLYDESYWQMTGDADKITVLATSQEDGQATPQIWVRDHRPGRVFVSIPGHYSWTFDDPLFRILLLRGICWTANQPLDRLNELVLPGARWTD
ncbi:MAG: ThuA domain-containing protein [Pirellulaceae bacterium]|nr:ThuA domain-containing protein [Pirellulaceae bacterium]